MHIPLISPWNVSEFQDRQVFDLREADYFASHSGQSSPETQSASHTSYLPLSLRVRAVQKIDPEHPSFCLLTHPTPELVTKGCRPKALLCLSQELSMCNSLPNLHSKPSWQGARPPWSGGAEPSGSPRSGALISCSPWGPVSVMSPVSACALQRGVPHHICLAYLELVKHGFLFCLLSSRSRVPMSCILVLWPQVVTSCCFLAASETVLQPPSGLMRRMRPTARLPPWPGSLALFPELRMPCLVLGA